MNQIEYAMQAAYALGVEDANLLRARFRDFAVELEKHSNDHIRDNDLAIRLGAAVEGICANRINAILNLRETGTKESAE